MPLSDSARTAAASGSGQRLYQRARGRIPGGTQLLGKRPEQFLPGGWPAYYQRAEGCRVWDLDGREYLDFTSNGIGSCLLGFAHPGVNAAVADCIARGSMSTLNCPQEVELADQLCALHPWAEQVRYARTGGEAMAIAVRLARAATGRSTVAFCGYHGWSDWYLAANLGETDALAGHLLPGLDPRGVPGALRGSALAFRYNRIEELEAIVSARGSGLAAVVMEPMRHEPPHDGFLAKVRTLADRCGAALVFDEITAGWRTHHGGIHLGLGVAPDVAVFAKALSNGFPMAAIIGRQAVMESAQDSFVSSTYWTEAIGPTAAVATLRHLAASEACRRLQATGAQVRTGWAEAAAVTGAPAHAGGIPALCILSFAAGDQSRALMTLFTQEMLDRGFLAAGAFYPTLAHQPEHVARYLEAVTSAFRRLREHLDRGTVLTALRGPVAQSGFARLT